MKNFFLICFCFLLSSCSIVYTPDVTQGNYLTLESVNKIKKNMSREQVIFILGSSALDNIYDDSLHYVYLVNKSSNSKRQLAYLNLYFNKDKKLFKIEKNGNFVKIYKKP